LVCPASAIALLVTVVVASICWRSKWVTSTISICCVKMGRPDLAGATYSIGSIDGKPEMFCVHSRLDLHPSPRFTYRRHKNCKMDGKNCEPKTSLKPSVMILTTAPRHA
jgi:hypothetical protein